MNPYKSWKPVNYPKILLHNFVLFDSIQDRLQTGKIILIRDQQIEAIQENDDINRYADYFKIDMAGRTLMSGLIDNHAHLTVPFMYDINLQFILQMDQQILMNFQNCVMCGVTTVRDMGGMPQRVLKYRSSADSNQIAGPRMVVCLSPIAARDGKRLGPPEKAPYITNPLVLKAMGGNYAERPTAPEDIRFQAERMLSLGAEWLKTLHQDHSYAYFPRPLPNHSDEGYRTILDVGKKHGIKCAMHQTMLTGFQKGVDLGFDTLEHIPVDFEIPDEYVDRFIEKGMTIHPTVMAFGDEFKCEEMLDLVEHKGSEFLVPEAIKQMSRRMREQIDQTKRELSEEEKRQLKFDNKYLKDHFPVVMANLQKLYRKGAKVGIATDNGGVVMGFFGRYSEELKYYAQAAIPNFEILQMATLRNAITLGKEKQIGSVEEGKYADLIAFQGDPLKDVAALEKVDFVMKNGTIIKQLAQ